MVYSGRIELTEKEESAVNNLLENHEGNASITRRDPGETGPVIVEAGEKIWEIGEAGKAKKVSK